MDFRFNDDQREMRDAVRSFCEGAVAPHAEKRDQDGCFEDGFIEEVAELGLFGTYIPEQYGGTGLEYTTYLMTVEELSRACGATGILVSAHHSLCVDPILGFGSEEQKQKYLPKLASGEWIGCFSLTEPGSGSDAGAAKCMAVETGDGWVINGTKSFVTNGLHAHVIVLFAVTDADNPKRRMSAFVLEKDTPGCSIGKVEKKMGIRASSTTELVFEDCHLPHEALLGERGRGLNIGLATLDGGRLGVASQALGISEAALACGVSYSQERVQFDRPIASFQAIQWKLADMAVWIAAARALTYRGGWLKQNRKPYGVEAAMAKLYASEMSSRVTNAALQVYGGYGYCVDYPAERLLRDAKITELYEGTSEIQRLVIARQILAEPQWVARG
ncbi:MAG: acyl-CoA dehydrogenase family protein [Phycisphaerae bacterium]